MSEPIRRCPRVLDLRDLDFDPIEIGSHVFQNGLEMELEALNRRIQDVSFSSLPQDKRQESLSILKKIKDTLEALTISKSKVKTPQEEQLHQLSTAVWNSSQAHWNPEFME